MLIFVSIIIIFFITEILIYFFLKKFDDVKWLIHNENINFNADNYKNFKENIYNENLGWDYKFVKNKKNFITSKGYRKSNYSSRKSHTLLFGDSYAFSEK